MSQQSLVTRNRAPELLLCFNYKGVFCSSVLVSRKTEEQYRTIRSAFQSSKPLIQLCLYEKRETRNEKLNLQPFAQSAKSIAATTRKSEKVAILAEYFRSRPMDEAATAAVFFSGRAFPAYEETTLQVGGSLLWRIAAEVAQGDDQSLSAAYRKYGDLGDAVAEVFAKNDHAHEKEGIAVLSLAKTFRHLAEARGTNAKAQIIRKLLQDVAPQQARYIVKIILGDLRIGLRESLVEEAIAKAFCAEAKQVQRANMMLGDIGETLRLAAAQKLSEAHMRLFHPIGFMLASPVESAAEALEYFAGEQASIEDKYDGIRAQAHIGEHEGLQMVRIFSRTLDEITESFPELRRPLASFTGDLVFDGEIVAWQGDENGGGRALPFSELQKRLGRKKVSEAQQRSVPVAYVIFDVLYAEGNLVIDLPLRERYHLLNEIFAATRNPIAFPALDPQGQLAWEPAVESAIANYAEIIRAPIISAESPADLEKLFDLAQQRGNEGLMIKDFNSLYTPGRRGKAWLKLKRELATLDVVVTAAEFGHGKRAGVLSDYTFCPA